MASSSPAILPITNNPPQSAAAAAAPVSTPAFRAFISHITDSLRHGLAQRRPWSELLDRSAFSRPESLSDATFRLRKNYSYFRINYVAVVATILAVSLLTNPFSLLLLVALLAAWLFLYLFRPSDQPLTILGRTYSDSQTLIGLVGLSVVVVFLTSVGSVIISALMLGFAVVAAHAAFRVPEDLFLDEQDSSASAGFLSFLTGAGASAAVSAASPAVVAARV